MSQAAAPAKEALTPGLTSMELAALIQSRLQSDSEWAWRRRRTWSRGATAIRLVTLALSGTATVLLGLAALDGLAAYGFICSAIVTTAAAVEPFFNWRSRWVLAEGALAAWLEVDEALGTYVASTPEEMLNKDELLVLDARRREIWSRFNEDWLTQRNAAAGLHQ